ncbi:MAG TPA: ABC transporter ATP-binding protein [Steroidobacteraceae bacterium]
MSGDSSPAIDVHGLNKSFKGKPAVRDLTMQVQRGEIFGFLGPNGSGKTTSIRLMCGLLTPDSGSGTCLGFDILRQRDEIKRNVGYMTQRFSYWEDLSIRENLDFVAHLYQMSNPREAVDKALVGLGLKERADQLAGTLSGGWKQRLALAACMLHRPQLLLLDEPTAGVDPAARRDFWDELHRLAAQGISVLVSTHYMDEAERCQKLAYIANGKLLALGTATEVIAKQGLTSFAIHGDHLAELSQRLRGQPGVDQIVAFGTALHVTGTDGQALQQTVAAAAHRANLRFEPIDTSLEDVFIYLMNRSGDSAADKRS